MSVDYRSCATAGATVDDAVPAGERRYASCATCGGLRYVRPDGTAYANARQVAQARRRTVGRTAAARTCDCCRAAGAHRTA